MAAYDLMCGLPEVSLVYITYHVDVGETPFLIAVDHKSRSVVVCIRGTLSLKVREEIRKQLCAFYAVT